MPIPTQTNEQQSAAETAAGLSSTQSAGVAAGTGYVPVAAGTDTQNGDGTAKGPAPVTNANPTYDNPADAPTPAADPIVVPTPAINRPIAVPKPGDTQGQTDAAAYLDNFQAPETEDQIIARKTKEAADSIKTSKDLYASLTSDQGTANDLNTRETNARSVLGGLQGSSAASSAAVATADQNAQKLKTLKAQGASDLQTIYKGIQDSAYTEAEAQKNDATASAKDILARKDTNRTQATADITTLAKSGFDFSAIKTSDPTTYQHLVDSVGGEDQLNALAVLNRPQDTILDKSVQGGKYVIAYQNPLTGKVTIQSTDLGLPAGYKQVGDAGDRLLFAPADWDGDSSKVISFSKGAIPKVGTGTGGLKTVISGTLTATADDITRGVQLLNTSKGADNYVDPAIYSQMYTDWTNSGGRGQDFITQYPPKLYVNPKNTTLPAYLRPASGTTSTNSGTIDNPFK